MADGSFIVNTGDIQGSVTSITDGGLLTSPTSLIRLEPTTSSSASSAKETTLSQPNKLIMPQNVIGLLLWDNDGTFIPGTEVRNRIVLDAIVAEFSTSARDAKIDWSVCNGCAETDIHQILTDSGYDNFAANITAQEFEDRCRYGYKVTAPNCTAREGAIESILGYRAAGVHSLLVSNSEQEPVLNSVHNALKIHQDQTGQKLEVEDLFSLVVTKTDIVRENLKPKPAADPFAYAVKLAQQSFAPNVTEADTHVLEDSGTGVMAGESYTGNKDQVSQFVELATAHPKAGHHHKTMDECRRVINNQFGLTL